MNQGQQKLVTHKKGEDGEEGRVFILKDRKHNETDLR